MDKESACRAGDTGGMGSVPESGRSPGGGCENSLQYFCLENSMDRGAWQATVHGFTELDTIVTEHTSIKALLPNTVTLGAEASMDEF